MNNRRIKDFKYSKTNQIFHYSQYYNEACIELAVPTASMANCLCAFPVCERFGVQILGRPNLTQRANGSPPLQHLNARSCVALALWRGVSF